MKIEWSPHAQERAKERGISEYLVREIIRQPQQVIGRGAHQVFQSRYVDPTRQKDYVLRVCVQVQHGVTLIRSVYRTSKIKKYWRVV